MLFNEKDYKDYEYAFSYIISSLEFQGKKSDRKTGDFFQIIVKNKKSILIFVSFDLDGHILGIELGEEIRHNRILLFKRNFNGDIYIFEKNLANIEADVLDYYLDYYNETVVQNKDLANKFINEIYDLLTYLSNNKVEYNFANTIQEKIILIKEKECEVLDLWKLEIDKCSTKILEIDNLINYIYHTPLSVLPPEVRPDINSDYIIIQTVSGCRIMEQRGRACAFCASFTSKYEELSKFEVELEIERLFETYPNCVNKANKVFLVDGDPLCASNKLMCMQLIKEKIENINKIETFISTNTIINLKKSDWKELCSMGLAKVYWGVESGDDETLHFLNKPQNRIMLEKAREILEENGIIYDIIVMAGLTEIKMKMDNQFKSICKNHIKATASFINESKCDGIYISKLQIIDGTQLYNFKQTGDLLTQTSEQTSFEYRNLIKNIINKKVKGAYGSQFVIS